MKSTTLFSALILCIAIAGCEQPPSTSDNKPVAENQPTKPAKPSTTEVAQQPKAEWHKHGKSADGAVIEPDPNDTAAKGRFEVEEEPPPEKDPPIPEAWKPLNKERTFFFENSADGKKRVHLLTRVCLREGQLEVLLCKTSTKEHEAILHIDLDAREIHAALLAAGGKPGSTVKFVPKYVPATGDPIKVTLTYYKDGKLETNKPAQSWIQHIRTKKELEHNWVFAGSREFRFPDEPNRPPYYCANNGEVISIANFSDSMLDLPVMSSKEAAELGYVANKDKIPSLKTKVIVTLEVLKKG